MKIFTDFNDIIPYRSKINTISQKLDTIPAARSNESNFSKSNYETFNNMNMERSFMDALSISQMSQSIIQKAMTISTRLRSIASQAFTTGKINVDDLNNSISEIDTSIKDYGEKVIMPSNIYGKSENIPDITQTENTLKILKAAAGSIKTEGRIDTERLDNLDKALTRNNSALTSSMDKLKDSINTLINRYPRGGMQELKQTGDKIINAMKDNPGLVMLSQGNISHQNAVSLVS